jgi:hypothetical protein
MAIMMLVNGEKVQIFDGEITGLVAQGCCPQGVL